MQPVRPVWFSPAAHSPVTGDADVSSRRTLAVPACSLLESLSKPPLSPLTGPLSSYHGAAGAFTGPGHRSCVRRWGAGITVVYGERCAALISLPAPGSSCSSPRHLPPLFRGRCPSRPISASNAFPTPSRGVPSPPAQRTLSTPLRQRLEGSRLRRSARSGKHWRWHWFPLTPPPLPALLGSSEFHA